MPLLKAVSRSTFSIRKKPQPSTRATLNKSNEFPIGRIAGIFGIRGELKCDPSDSGRALFFEGAALSCDVKGKRETVHLESVREHKGRLLIALDEAPDATSADRYIGATFYAQRDELDVAEDEYLDVDLVGCDVISVDGKQYGQVSRVDHYPGNDMLIVGSYMLPMVAAFIKSIDVKKKAIVVEVPPGLLDGDSVSS
ncbi:MAG: 16S rRNA processing protein RimM [Candidatus Eremiobacteraeota bacterium]|nr:16S rRNA processing protein RimM [Candidatus Eremiobacteraeota bacterium]